MLMSCIKGAAGGDSQYKFEYIGTPSQAKITLGFKPKQLFLQTRYSGSQQWDEKIFYDENVSKTQVRRIENTTDATIDIGTSGSGIYSIDDDGFTMGWGGSGASLNLMYQCAYLAIG